MKRSFIMVLAMTFTFLFAWMYIQLFIRNTTLSAGSESEIVYYLQVGVFSKYENAMRRIEDLKADDIQANYYEKDQHYYVVTGLSTDVAKKEKVKQKLLDEGYGSYDKEIMIQDEQLLLKVEQQSYDQLLEVMRLSK